LKWLYSALSSPTAQWPWRWTISLYAFFWILFAVVMGASGAARQTSWLLQFKEPIYKPREYAGLRIASSELEAVLLEGKGDLRKAQSYLAASRRAGFGSWDQYQYVFLTDSSNRVETALIIPRDPEAQRKRSSLCWKVLFHKTYSPG
jgi:hypothetical protein